MGMIRKIAVTVTLTGANGSATGSADTEFPVSGLVLAAYADPGSQPNTLDVTITGKDPSAALTILTITNLSSAAWYYPRAQVQSNAGAGLTYDGTQPISEPSPVDGYITIAGAQGNAGTFTVTLMVQER